ncbi:hypothetical protein [Stappia sp. TSB10GB4]|uniref:hypothetical protein n=1 Tax=Stappia sp. TSB10GB4 TaxID=2003584 RepID=UPI001645AAC5|nr:hypothetical protein [Stappia sp. TSB10GB4]
MAEKMSDALIDVVLGGGGDVVAEAPKTGRRTDAISAALKEASRRIRSNRRVIGGGGFRRRRGERLFLLSIIASGLLVVLVPVLVAGLYFGLIASDRYESEMQFSLRNFKASAPAAFMSLTGLPTGNLMQEAKVVQSYVHSRALVDHLLERTDLFGKFNSPDIDVFSRFPQGDPIEDFMEYWRERVGVHVETLSGIVTVTVQAFSAQDAQEINSLILEAVDQLVNELSARARADLLQFNRQDLDQAQERLKALSEDLAALRNSTGLLDPELYAKSISAVATELEVRLSDMRVRQRAALGSMNADTPQMRFLARQIETLESEIVRLRQEIASPGSTGETLSTTKALFDRYLLDQEIARKQYTQASLEYERARLDADRRQVYTAVVMQPTLPEDAEYPRRIWSWTVVLVLCISAWGALVGLAVLIRNHLAA